MFLDARNYGESLVRDLSDAPPHRFPESSMRLEKGWNEFQKFAAKQERTDANATVGVVENLALLPGYRRLFSPRLTTKALAEAPLSDLPILFSAAERIEWKTGDIEPRAHLNAVFQELKRRGIDTRRVFNPAMLSALVSSRQLAAAREFVRRQPDPQSTPIPEIVDYLGEKFVGRSVLDPHPLVNKLVSCDATLARRAIDPVRGTEIIMEVGAACHFSRDALKDIVLTAPLLAKLRAANLLVLMSQVGHCLPTL